MFLFSSDFWEIKDTKSKGKGVFAKKEISPGIVIGDYIGTVINPRLDKTSEKDLGLYLMYYHDYALVYPQDTNSEGVHLINHSCAPNCSIYIYQGHTLFFSLRKIFPGEELTISYQLAPNKFCRGCTHQCKCSSKLCTSSMHLSEEEFKEWDFFHETQSKETKRKRVSYGKPLKKLEYYPETIPDHPIYKLIGNLEKEPLVFKDLNLPSQAKLRKLIREKGRALEFPRLKLKILGVQNNVLLSQSL